MKNLFRYRYSSRGAFLCILACLLLCLDTEAQIPSAVPSEWKIGGQTVKLSNTVQKAIETSAANFDIPHIQQNIVPIMLMLEWTKTCFSSLKKTLPDEYCYLILYNNHLVKKYHSQSQVTKTANMKFWGLSDTNIIQLQLEEELQNTDTQDDSRNLEKTTVSMANKIVEANANFDNWLLSMLLIEHNYDEARKKIKAHYGESPSLYKNKQIYELDMHANIFIEYFALRHVLEHIIVNQPTPSTHLVRYSPDKTFGLEAASKIYHVSTEELSLYNPSLKIKSRRISKDVVLSWLVPQKREHAYLYPTITKLKEVVQNPKPPQPTGKNTANEGGASLKDEEKLIAPTIQSQTDNIQHLHIVRKGETLFQIAGTYSIALYQLRLLNPNKMKTDFLSIGEALLIRARNMKEQEDRQRTKNFQVFRGGNSNTFEKKMKVERLQARVEQSINPVIKRGADKSRYPARRTPIESKKNRPYKKSEK